MFNTNLFHFRDINITAVDIDSSMLTVATKFFGLTQDNRLKVVIDDGIEFLKKTLKNGIFDMFSFFDLNSISFL